jgi:hypothetical protein
MPGPSGDNDCNIRLSSGDKASVATNLSSIAEHIAPLFVTLLNCSIKFKATRIAAITFSRWGRVRVLSRMTAEHRKGAVSKIKKVAKWNFALAGNMQSKSRREVSISLSEMETALARKPVSVLGQCGSRALVRYPFRGASIVI